MPPLITESELADRFWSRVDRSGGSLACWPWVRSKTAAGYGSLGWKSAPSTYAHVVAYVLTNGPLPEDRPCVLHSCDNPACCNPCHLTAGTKADNSADMASKQRSAIGQANPSAKLDDAAVTEIRALAAGGVSQREIASRYGVDRSAVSLIVNRRAWAHIQ